MDTSLELQNYLQGHFVISLLLLSKVSGNVDKNKRVDSKNMKAKSKVRPTRQQWVDGLSVTDGLLMKECLSMEVDTVEVFGRAHVDQVPGRKLVGVHPEALQIVYNAIDGLEYSRQKIIQLVSSHIKFF